MDEFSANRIRRGDLVRLKHPVLEDDAGLWKVTHVADPDDNGDVWISVKKIDEFGVSTYYETEFLLEELMLAE
jgi:hypothetical protein